MSTPLKFMVGIIILLAFVMLPEFTRGKPDYSPENTIVIYQ